MSPTPEDTVGLLSDILRFGGHRPPLAHLALGCGPGAQTGKEVGPYRPVTGRTSGPRRLEDSPGEADPGAGDDWFLQRLGAGHWLSAD